MKSKSQETVWYEYVDPQSGSKYYADKEGNTRWEKPKKGKIVVLAKDSKRAAAKKTSTAASNNVKKADGGAVFYFGKPNPKQQEFKCNYGDCDSLMKSLPPDINPIANWKSNAATGSGSSSNTFPTPDVVTSWFRNDEAVAFYGPPLGTRSPLTYARLHEQIKSFPAYKTPSTDGVGVCVVALLLPPTYMAETGAVLMTLIAQKGICVAPIDPGMPLVKVEAALTQLQCTALITTEDLFEILADKAKSLKDIRFIKPDHRTNHRYVGAVEWDIVQNRMLLKADFDLHDHAEPPAMLLRTSGTTSTPKIVPLTRTGLLYNAICLASSLSLDPRGEDVGCNGMPLFHIGGIAANLMAVLVSGTSVVMLQDSFDGQAFFEALTTKSENGGKYKQPNWYSGVPSMHKSILLASKTNRTQTKNNRLRFIRSGAAHLPHGTAVEMAQVFQTHVYPTYSMSECMPICSSNDAPVTGLAADRKGVPDDTVGVPTGGSMAIVDAAGKILPYGEIGQVAIRGPGVIDAYIGIPLTKSHTAEGWFLTGDMGQLDRNGRLVLSGRQKEMIKRGGDQVWPNEVDGAVESVPGVRLAVTFGVPNELWGEEVQVAVVLDNEVKSSINKEALEQQIREACTTQLGAASAPSNVLYVEAHQLLKGNTGKFLRMKMAEHLGAKAVDTKALHALEQMAALAGEDPADRELAKVAATPSTALNGMRFIVACFVVWLHIGYAPNDHVAKMQTFSFNMIIFFILGGFQLVTALKSEVLSSSAQFIGTKIGSMHAWYLVAQIIALPALLIGSCSYPKEVFQALQMDNCMDGSGQFWWYYISYTITGMGLPFPFIGYNNAVNGVTWFQQVFYQFLILFPILDYRLRYSSRTKKLVVFWVTLIVGVGGVALLHHYYSYGEPDGVVQGLIYLSILSWLPTLVLSMLFGYWFSEHACLEDPAPGQQKTSLWERPKHWGYITDFLSLLFLSCMIGVAFSPNCLWTTEEIYGYMRPGQNGTEGMTTMNVVLDQTIITLVKVCDTTYEEYETFVYPSTGSWRTEFGMFAGSFGLRLATPLLLVWIYGLAYGRGITARIFDSFVLQWLSTFAYPVYLLQLPVVRFYWMATRGLPLDPVEEGWWAFAGSFQVPVNLWEVPIVIVLCVLLAWPVERFVVQPLTPHTISWGVKICKLLAKCLCCGQSGGEAVEVGDSTQAQVEHMVKGLTGNQDVSAITKLTDLGLDSLGATALLGALKSTVPNAKTLTMAQLSSCETVGDLVEVLDGSTEPDEGDGIVLPV